MVPRPDLSPDDPLTALARPLAMTRAAMVAERAARAFWPFVSIVAAGFAAAGFGAFGLWAPALWGVLAAAALAAGWGLWRFRWPSRAEGLARLDARLPGRPIAALSDVMALGGADPAARALWAAHRARMAAAAAGARAPAPAPDLAPRDPFALRLTALTALALALIFGAPARMLDPSAPFGPGAVEAAMGPSWEGWVSPPRYTGKPGIYLNSLTENEISVPEGSRFAFRFYGAPGAVPFSESVSNPAAPAQAEDQAALQKREFEAERSGAIEIGGAAGRSLTVTVVPDAAPAVELVNLAERRADGKLAQAFHAFDDYAVTAGRARITLDLGGVSRRYGLAAAPELRADLVFDLPLPISGSRADFIQTLVEDAAKHPWANLPVVMELEVEDGRGQAGSSGPQALDLPGRRFFDPLAAALIEARRDLLWSRANARAVAGALRAVSHRPETLFPSPAQAGTVRLIALRLEAGPLEEAARDEIAEALWTLAEELEDGGLADALAAMQQAQARLSEAIRNGASKDEIAKLMQELKEATDRYIEMLAERAKPEEGPQFGREAPSQQITGDQIQQMMDQIQKLMEEGKMAEAQEMLEQLSRMLENLEVSRQQGGEGQADPTMKGLSETLRNQQELSDEAFKQMQEGFGQPFAPEGAEPGPQGEGAEGQGAEGQGQGDLASRQRALRRELGQQQGLMPRLGSEAGEAARQRLDEAGRAMEEAEEALRQGDDSTAIDRQADAIEALREGMRRYGEAMAEEQGRQAGEPGGQQLGDATGGAGAREMPRDPLGRNLGDGNQFGAQDEMLGAEDVYRRARDLLDEIRRRTGERLRPEEERDYLRRLLEAF
ncbi:hypothetical protein LPB142_02945 [Rhodobacter xanthinilyticus]|uniref:TIGR02302 family protein n=1 Tax=Rhodobacter xanthinilyticus TaxID=1850250 RepID=A0A1D9M9B1_9RHOB|nr:DUF4175 family protein [Rhodobacter xanthinilyticus]AOZ68398.1 hypothetical protein LPB142_02945 [Rhodobacter xanthinilyticus]